MDQETLLKATAIVVVLSQLAKWATGGRINDHWAVLIVIFSSSVVVGLWGWSTDAFIKDNAFNLLMTWGSLALQSAGVFGFTRAAATAVLQVKKPPEGGGA